MDRLGRPRVTQCRPGHRRGRRDRSPVARWGSDHALRAEPGRSGYERLPAASSRTGDQSRLLAGTPRASALVRILAPHFQAAAGSSPGTGLPRAGIAGRAITRPSSIHAARARPSKSSWRTILEIGLATVRQSARDRRWRRQIRPLAQASRPERTGFQRSSKLATLQRR